MRITRFTLMAAAVLVCRADVKTEEKTQFKMEGMLGRMMSMFGGRGAREGTINTVAVKGNRKMTVNDQRGQLVDLDEEKVYEIDFRDRSYKVTTFDEMRRRMQEARERMAKTPPPPGEPPAQKQDPNQMEMDFSLKESGQKKNINGYDCREVVMTIVTRQKGKTLEEGGGMVMTSNMWLAPKIAAMKEIQDFDLRYARKMADAFLGGGGAEQMGAALALYPYLKEMMGKFQAENVNLDGTAILTVMSVDMVADAQAAQQQQQQQAQQRREEPSTNITSVRGLGGMIGRRMAKRKTEEPQNQPDAPAAGGARNRATFMTTTHELVRVATALSPSDVVLPAGFKEKK